MRRVSIPAYGARRRAVLFGAGIWLGILTSAAGALPKGLDSWRRLETENFTFLTNADEERVRELAQGLEELRHVLAQLQGSAANTPLPTKIFVFANDAAFKPYKPRFEGRPASISGYFQPGPYGNVVALDGSPRRDSTEVVLHEYLHYFASHNFPEVPLWFNEGLAEFYSNFEIDGDEALLGRPKLEHVHHLQRNRLIPMAEFLALDTRSEHYNERSRQGVFYAQAWALVHYFLAGGEARQESVTRYLDLLADGEDQDRAFRLAFGTSYSELERELERYVQGAELHYFRVRLAAPPGDLLVRIVPLSRADVLYELGDLLAHLDATREGEARAHLEAALAAEPGHGLAHATLGQLQDRAGNLAVAAQLYRRATELAPDEPLPWFLHGLALTRLAAERIERNGHAEETDLEELAAARASLRRSLALERDFGPARATLGLTYLFDEPPLAEGLDVLVEAHRRLPGSVEVTFNLAVIAARLGRFEGARGLIEGTLARQAEREGQEELVSSARYELARAELAAAVAMLESGQVEEALELADNVESRADDNLRRQIGAMVTELHRAADELERVERYNQAVDLYNRAVELANGQQFEAALEALRELDGASSEPELRRAAAQLEREVRRFLAARP